MEQILPQDSKRNLPCLCLGLRLAASRARDNTLLLCKPPSLPYFVTTALVNQPTKLFTQFFNQTTFEPQPYPYIQW